MLVVADSSPLIVLIKIGNDEIENADFWISHKLLDACLKLYLQRKCARDL